MICLMLAMLLNGCSDKENYDIDYQSATNTSDVSTVTMDSLSEIDGTSTSDFSFSASLNVFSSDDISVPIENKMEIIKGEIVNIKLRTNVSPDESMITENIPMRLWIIADGVPIDFCVNNSDYKAVNDILVDAFEEMTIDASFMCSDDVGIITVETVYFPEDIPKLGLGAYGGEISYTIVNTVYSSENKCQNSNDKAYVNVPQKEENYGIDVGILTVEENNNKALEMHFYNDVILDLKEDDLLVKFNSGDEKEISYYIFILCDGAMVSAFDNNFSCMVNCSNGLKTFQHTIPGEYIPESGLHTFQVIATPAEPNEDLSSYATPKIRVQIQ